METVFRKKMSARGGVYLIVWLILSGSGLSGRDVWPLDEIYNPGGLSVYGDKAFILQESTVFVYSLPDRRLLFKFGRNGEGPGEIPLRPFRTPMIFVTGDSVFLDCDSKWIKFNHEGKLIREQKKDYINFVILPLEDRFVTLQRHVTEGRERLFKVALCTGKFETIIQLFEQPTPVNGNTISLFPDSVNFWVHDDRIFVEQSATGMAFSIFNYRGKRLDRVSINYSGYPVSQEEKEAVYQRLADDPETRNAGGIEAVKRMFDFRSPEFPPSIREITADDRNVYLLTFRERAGKTEFVIWNVVDRKAATVCLPSPHGVLFDDELTGRLNRFYHFYEGYYYYLKESDTEETWNLCRIPYS